MHYTVLPEQKFQFQEEGSVAFEGILSPEEIELIQTLDLGRDPSRGNETLRALVTRRNLGEVAAELFEWAPLRIAYDEVLDGDGLTLLERSGFQGIVGGMLISPEGLITFLSRECPVPEGRFFLVVFAEENFLYGPNDKDPHNHYLKKLGYGFGDSPTLETHPWACRKRI